MSPNRREFLWTVGTAAGAFALLPVEQIFFAPETAEDVGWSPGIEERLRSACLVCPARCGITGRVVDGRLVRLIGNPLHPMSRGGLCPRGVAGVQMLYHPERVASPLVRVGDRGSGEWRPVSHEEAVRLIGGRLAALREAGHPEGLTVLAGYDTGTLDAVWRQFTQAFGSPNYVRDALPDATDALMAAMHGVARAPAYDLDGADMVLSFGAPLFEAWWSPLQAYTAFGRPGTQGDSARAFVQVDHRFSRTAAHADAWVGVHAGTHAALALGMAYVMLRDRLFDERFLADHVAGFEDFTDAQGRRRQGFRSVVLQRYRTEEASALTGVSVERINELARAFALAQRPLAVCGADVTLAPNGLAAAMAIHSLNLLVGAVNRPGGVLLGEDPPLAPLAPLAWDEAARRGFATEPIGGAPPPLGQGDPAGRFVRAAASDAGPVPEVLFVHDVDPLGGAQDHDLWVRVLQQAGYVVSFSPFLDETTRHADLVLPGLLAYERWQDAPTPPSYPYPAWGLVQPLVEPPEGGAHTGEVAFELARALGGSVAESLPYDSFETLLETRARGLFDAGRGRTFATAFEIENQRQQEERGWWLGTHENFESFWDELVERGGWTDPFYDYADPDHLARTPSGRIELLPATVLAQLEALGQAPQPYVLAAAEQGRSTEDFPLRLLPYRVSTLSSDTIGLERWLAEQPTVLPDVQWTPWVSVAPVTSEALGLSENEMIRVVSRRGSYRARLKVSVGVAPLTVCAPYGLRHPDGEAANPLRLLEESTDPLSGVSSWHTTFVRLEQT